MYQVILEEKKKLNHEWQELFDTLDSDFKDLGGILDQEEKEGQVIVPRKCDLFKAFELCPPREVRVVIIGQDPYFNMANDSLPQATGLSFSVRPGVPPPSSLVNIFKEIKNEYPEASFSNGCLESWAKQGIFLLNSSLTCRLGEAGSHEGIWMFLIIETIKYLAKLRGNCIYVLWGKHAQKMKKYIGNKSGGILESAHPSGFSAYGRNGKDGFFGNGHFKEINRLLTKDPKDPMYPMGPIKWSF